LAKSADNIEGAIRYGLEGLIIIELPNGYLTKDLMYRCVHSTNNTYVYYNG